MDTPDNKTWNVAVLNIDWQADRHNESHSIEFGRPTEDNPHPKFPVVKGEVLPTHRLPMSDSWGSLFASVVVKDFDEHSLTVQYGKRTIVLRPGEPWVKLDEGGMSYTTFWLFLGVKYVEPKEPEENPFRVTHDEQFLRRFRVKERVLRLKDEDVEQLRKAADTGDVYAQYGLGRWLYCKMPTDDAVRQAEELFLAAKNYVPDAMAAYAIMWHFGETKENVMDLDKSNKLLQQALQRGSEQAAQQLASDRIFGRFCEAEPAIVAREIEQRLSTNADCDPHWHAVLAYAYEVTDRTDEAIEQYEQAIERGDTDNYYFMAVLYRAQGDMARYDSLMEEGISKGSASCCIYRADTSEDDYQQQDFSERYRLHLQLADNLRRGLALGDGYCAYALWLLHYCETLGFRDNTDRQWTGYLKQGVRLGDYSSIIQMARLATDGKWPERMSQTDIAELWLRAARNMPSSTDAVSELRRVSDPAFLLRHKDELERYWLPCFKED